MTKTLLAATAATAMLCAGGVLAAEVKSTGTVVTYDATLQTFTLDNGKTYYLIRALPYTAQTTLIGLAAGKQVAVTAAPTAGMNVVIDLGPATAVAHAATPARTTTPAPDGHVAARLEGKIVAINTDARTLTLDNGHEYKMAQGVDLGGLTVGRNVALSITEGGGAPYVAAVAAN